MRRGAERELRGLAQRQAAAGHQVQVVAGTRQGLIRRNRDGPVVVTRVRVASNRRTSDEAAWALSALPALAVSRADLLHAWHYGDGAAAALVKGRRPLILKVTGCVPHDSTDLRRTDRSLLRRALEGADEVWVNDDWVVDAMAGWGVPMVVIPPGVDLDAFSPGGQRADVPTVLAVGALTEPRKRLDVLIRRWPDVCLAVPGAQLRIAGAGDNRLLPKVLDRPFDASVEILGPLDTAALADEYRRAWVLAAPAGDEAFGLSVAESLASGTPVIGVNTGATPGLLRGDDGSAVVGYDDVDGFISALVTRLSEPPSTDEAASRVSLAQRFGWSTVVDVVEQRYRRLLSG